MVLDDTPLLVLDDCVLVLDDRLQVLCDRFWVLDDSGKGVTYKDVAENINMVLFACLNHYCHISVC